MTDRLRNNSSSYSGACPEPIRADADSRLTGVGSTSYSYDDNGNLTARGNDSFSWDAADRLTSATVGGTTTTFGYNGDGLRDSLTTGGNTTTFTWDINAQNAQVLDDGSFKYIYGLGRIAQVYGSTTNYYLTDGLGSVVAVCNSSGTVLNTYNYDVFGAIRSSSGSQANAWTLTGEQTDGTTGLEYLRARYYDNATGRFLSKDPAGTGYRYARGNPVSFMDPSGLYEICGPNEDWGFICFDSTDVGLPADPPDSCNWDTNQCYWENGLSCPFESGGGGGDCSSLTGANAEGGDFGSASATAGCEPACSSGDGRDGSGASQGGTGTCLADQLIGIGCIPEINDVIDFITSPCATAIMNEINEDLALAILENQGAAGEVPTWLNAADQGAGALSVTDACLSHPF